MSADGKIYITITDARTGEVIKDTDKPTPTPTKPSEEKDKTSIAKHQLWHFIENEAKQMAQYTISNIGNFTGDYNAQRQINFGLSVLNSAKNIGLAALYGGPVGAGIAVASMTINFGLQLHSENLEVKKQNHNIDQLRQLSGLDGLTNGSRI